MSSTTPTSAGVFSGAVAANRQPVGFALLALSLVLFVVGVWGIYKGFKAPADAPKPTPDAVDEAGKPVEAAKPVNPRQTEFVAGGIAAILGALVAGGCGAWFAAGLPKSDEAARLRESRLVILIVMCGLGLLLMLCGFLYFVLKYKGLAEWISSGKSSAAQSPLIALAMFLLGSGLAFLGTLPSRGEERNDPNLRRLVYGVNVVLSGVLLLLLLVAGNVFVALKVPNKLDTTSTGFYTLSPQLQEYLATLSQPVKVYSTLLNDDRVMRDARQLLSACQDANPSMFQVRQLSPGTTLDKEEIDSLKAKYPQADLNDFGILIVVGTDEKRYAFLRYEDLGEQTPGADGGLQFAGEARLVRELLYLSESKSRPVVYFTQDNGELEIAPKAAGSALGRTPANRSANDLKSALEKNYTDVRPLSFSLTDPKVPADAACVVVADPTVALPPEHVKAIEAYLDAPREGGKKGKLVVLAGAHKRAEGGMQQTGLEGLLARFGVVLGSKFLYGQPAQRLPSDTFLAMVLDPSMIADGKTNPIVGAFGETGQQFPFTSPRTITLPKEAASTFRVEPLMATVQRITWYEENALADPRVAFEAFLQPNSEELQIRKQVSRANRIVAAMVSESGNPHAMPTAPSVSRIVAYGDGAFFSDETTRLAGGNPIQAQLFSTTIDWLRDRPAVAGLANKPYNRYTPNPKPDETNLLWLPGGLAALSILALGAGVWVTRRK